LIVGFNLTQPFFTGRFHTGPELLHPGQVFLEPFTVSCDSSHHEFLGGGVRPGTKLDKVTNVQIQDFEEELYLGDVVLWDFVFNFTRHGTLDFDQDPVFRDAIGRSAQKRPFGVLHKTQFVRLSSRQGVIHVPGHGLELCPVLRRLVPGPSLFENFFMEQSIRTFVPIESERARDITGREEILTEREPLLTPLLEVRSVQEFLDSGVHVS